MQRVNLKKGKMNEIGIEHLRKDLSGALEDMPVAITRRGKVVGYLVRDITNLTVKPYSSDVNLTVEKPRLPSSRKRVLKASVKAAEKDEFNPLKEPFRAVTHHRG